MNRILRIRSHGVRPGFDIRTIATGLVVAWLAMAPLHRAAADPTAPSESNASAPTQSSTRPSDAPQSVAAVRQRIAEATRSQRQGRFGEAEIGLLEALELARSGGDQRLVATVLGAQGDLHAALGRFEKAEEELTAAARMAEEVGTAAQSAALSNRLGNALALAASEADPKSATAIRERAAKAYDAAAAMAQRAGDAGLTARIAANRARLELDRNDRPAARAEIGRAVAALDRASASKRTTQTRIHLAQSWLEWLGSAEAPARTEWLGCHALLLRAFETAGATGDVAGAAWAQGLLGRLYALRGRPTEALTMARRAALDAQLAGERGAELRFELDAARQLVRLGRKDEAIALYEPTLEALAEVRPVLRLSYSRGPASLISEAALGRRELVDLLLERARAGRATNGGNARSATAGTASDADLARAQTIMERFKADELRDYFRDDCVDAYQEGLTGATDAALGAIVVYPIILDDRLEILVSRAGQMKQFTVEVTRDALEEDIRLFRRLLEDRMSRRYLRPARRLYDQLIRPLTQELEADPKATLVFVPDGLLRTIPMAALHDGERFLIETRPLATTPSLLLSNPQPIAPENARLLAAGLSEAAFGFPALPRVRQEIAEIAALYDSTVLLDDNFRKESLALRVETSPYSIVHVASHGQLSSRVEDSFILTHDGRIALTELSQILSTTRYRSEPIEIIVFSACETAAGDSRAALGLSGVAIRAGARSAIGTLWQVNDSAASRLMSRFYEELRQPGTSRATALRTAQREIIEDRRYAHPLYWAPFLLLSNWL